jgi:hypothetical protein
MLITSVFVEVEKLTDPVVVVAEAQENFAGYRSNCL